MTDNPEDADNAVAESSRTPILAAVDGGQSEVRLAVGPASDRTPPSVAVPGFTWNAAGPAATLARQVATAWQAVAERQPALPHATRIVLGLSGLPDDARDLERLARTVRELTGAEDLWLCRDAVTAHAGALPDRDGVVLSVGTGVACLGAVRERGETFHADGWGYLLGDAGGAFWIGRAGLQEVFRAYDGRSRPTALTGRALARYGPHHRIPATVHNSPTHVDDIARFAQDVCAEAEAGDVTAHGILATAADELAATVSVLAERYLAAAGGTAYVSVTGRLVAEDSLLHTLLARALRTRVPRSKLVPPSGTSLDGAWRLAVTDDPRPYPVTRFRRT